MQLPVGNLSSGIQRDLQRYFAAEWRDAGVPILKCDVVLALLRIGTPEARAEAEAIVGKPITVCPPHVPPWPPDPMPAKHRVPRVMRRGSAEGLTGDMLRRFQQVRVGMTLPQLLARGITKRDVRVWCQRNLLEVS